MTNNYAGHGMIKLYAMYIITPMIILCYAKCTCDGDVLLSRYRTYRYTLHGV